MKNVKLFGYVGAFALTASVVISSALTESVQARVITADAEKAGSIVHRVSHAMAVNSEYTSSITSRGYKWGQKQEARASKLVWVDSKARDSGYKWAKSSAADKSSRSIGAGNSKAAANPWGRRDFSEQAANPWGRRDFSEQAANPWGRRDFSEQSANPWGRRDFSEQAANPWGRRD